MESNLEKIELKLSLKDPIEGIKHIRYLDITIRSDKQLFTDIREAVRKSMSRTYHESEEDIDSLLGDNF